MERMRIRRWACSWTTPRAISRNRTPHLRLLRFERDERFIERLDAAVDVAGLNVQDGTEPDRGFAACQREHVAVPARLAELVAELTARQIEGAHQSAAAGRRDQLVTALQIAQAFEQMLTRL